MATKITKREMFAIIKTADFSGCSTDVDTIMEFLDHEIELCSRKRSSKPTAKQDENAKIKEYILESMADNTYYTITDMIRQFDELSEMSNQRVSALVGQLVNAELVTRIMEKRKALFIKK